MREIDQCAKCGEEGMELDIQACPICFKGVCRHCAVLVSGRTFCSQSCAEYFFHGDDDDPGSSDE
jgi:hypothetical protein